MFREFGLKFEKADETTKFIKIQNSLSFTVNRTEKPLNVVVAVADLFHFVHDT